MNRWRAEAEPQLMLPVSESRDNVIGEWMSSETLRART